MDEKKNETALPEEEITESVPQIQEDAVGEEQPQVLQEEVATEDVTESVEDGVAQEAETAEEVVAADKSSEVVESEARQTENSATAKPVNTEKRLVIIAVIVLAIAAIVGGIVLAKHVHDTKVVPKDSYTLEDGTPSPESPEEIKKAHNEAADIIVGEDATKSAKVKDKDAVDMVEEFSDKELGIEKAPYVDVKDENHSFMVANQAYVIEGKKYVQVIAAEKKKNKDGTFSIEPNAKFYISFNGKTILKEDMKNPGNYDTIK